MKVPARGGETLFASAAAAVEALPAEQLALLESLDCEHRCTALPYKRDALAIFHKGFRDGFVVCSAVINVRSEQVVVAERWTFLL